MLETHTNWGKMMSKIKYAVVLIATMFAVAASGVSANAAPATLSYTQFQATAGYKELAALSASSDAHLANQAGVDFNISVFTSVFGESMTSTVRFLATKTATTAAITAPDEETGEPFTINYGFANGSYFEEMTTAPLTGVPNAYAALARLGKSATKNLIYDSAVTPEGLSDIKPGTLFTGETISPLSQLSVVQETMTFSEVSETPNIQDASSTDYSYSAAVAESALSPAMTVDAKLTFDSNNHLKRVESIARMPGLNLTMIMTASVTVNNALVINLPTEKNSVHMKALVTMGKKIGAEKLVTTKAKALAAKAKALAKAAKKTLVAKHITDAAKALKYKITLVKNGAKLSTSYQGVTGSMCVVATKGVAVVSNC
jgi:hypothetical protein